MEYEKDLKELKDRERLEERQLYREKFDLVFAEVVEGCDALTANLVNLALFRRYIRDSEISKLCDAAQQIQRIRAWLDFHYSFLFTPPFSVPKVED